jgi:hypothetical protein
VEEDMNFNLPLKKKKKKKNVDFSMIDNLDSEKQNEGMGSLHSKERKSSV